MCHTIAYVDDLHIVTSDPDQLSRCVAILLDLIRVFRLSLSVLKSALWGSNPQALQPLHDQTSIVVVATLEAPGATWHLTKKAGLPTPKEERRAEKVRERLLRICHLPAHPALRSSEARRPGKFAGPFLPNWRAMRRLHASLSPKDAVVLLRIWAGAAMTASHRHTIDSQESALCKECQCEETVEHLMWHCPLHEQGRPHSLAWWHTLPPAASQSLLCPRNESLSFLTDWRRACRWGITVLTRRRAELLPQENDGDEQEDPDQMFDSLPHYADVSVKEGNGHFLVFLASRGYAFCARCFIARKARDAHFVLVKPCARPSELPLLEGDYAIRKGHIVRLIMGQWKTSSLRPKLVCVRCGREQWATAQFKSHCASGVHD